MKCLLKKISFILLFFAMSVVGFSQTLKQEAGIKPIILNPANPITVKLVKVESLINKNERFEKEDEFEDNKKSIAITSLFEDAVWQSVIDSSNTSSIQIVTQTDGVKNNNFISVPDPSGEIGVNYYVHSVNSSPSTYHVFNKDGTVAQLNLAFATLGNLGLGGGDGIILHDESINRWFMCNIKGDDSINIYVSKTENPLGEFYAYKIVTHAGGPFHYPDYPKLGIWDDKLIITAREFPCAVYVFDKTKLAAGLTVTPIKFLSTSYNTLLPLDVDGIDINNSTLPVVFDYEDRGNPDKSFLKYHTLTIDFKNLGQTSMSSPLYIDIAKINSLDTVIAQPGNTSYSFIDPNLVMYKVQYRKFKTYESILLNFTVAVNNKKTAAIRWIELRKTIGEWVKYQEGTFAPNDGLHRFMGSIAQDKHGNILLGYAVASKNKYPSLRFTGRKICDNLGIMTEPEIEIATGDTSIYTNRMGDYHQLSIDPLTGEDFWFCGEYGSKTGFINWKTKIVHAKMGYFCACLSGYSATVTGANFNSQNNFNGNLIISNVIGGTLPYTYSLNGGSFQSSFYFSSGLIVGNNTVVIKDANNCILTLSKILDVDVTNDTWKDYVFLYPNPNDGIFSVFIKGIPQGSSFDFTIFDAKASKVWEGNSGLISTITFLKSFNLNKLSLGTYLIKVYNKKSKNYITKKFVVGK